MSDVTHILSQIDCGDPSAAAQLLPLVYEELRKLAAAKLAQEKPGQALQATALYSRSTPSERFAGWFHSCKLIPLRNDLSRSGPH